MDIIEALFENQRMERLQDYLKRGRKLADVPLEELRTRWMARIREEAASAGAFDPGEEQDIRSEMAARKLEPPWDLVRDALDARKAKAKLQIELDLHQAAARFEADSRRRTS